MTGAVDKLTVAQPSTTQKEVDEIYAKYGITKNPSLEAELRKLKEKLLKLDMEQGDNSEIIDRVLKSLTKAKSLESDSLTWDVIWKHSIDKAKNLFLSVYAADCVVWPPLQLINFSFVPLQYQVLFVNLCNLLWNTFLSIVVNKPH